MRRRYYRRGEIKMSEFRIGHGYDVHRFASDRKLIIGGVDIPYEKGLLGHSDADVLCHAIADSLLGAVGERDIGYHFPDSDDRYKGISSLVLLEHVMRILKSHNAKISNIDSTVIMQKPHISKYIEEMKINISKALNVSAEKVNIKATTEEKLGFTGREEGVSAHAVCIVYI